MKSVNGLQMVDGGMIREKSIIFRTHWFPAIRLEFHLRDTDHGYCSCYITKLIINYFVVCFQNKTAACNSKKTQEERSIDN